MTYERQFLAGFDAAGISPKFLPAAYGMFGQESSFGRASPNVLQVTASTAAKPGYGLAPLSGQDINDPAKSSAFALQLLKAKAEHAGLSFENPADYPAILRLHNGGGDPNYVQHVAARTPLTIPEEVPTGPKEEPEMASQPAPQLTYVPRLFLRPSRTQLIRQAGATCRRYFYVLELVLQVGAHLERVSQGLWRELLMQQTSRSAAPLNSTNNSSLRGCTDSGLILRRLT